MLIPVLGFFSLQLFKLGILKSLYRNDITISKLDVPAQFSETST